MANYINKAGFLSYINTNVNTNGVNSTTGAMVNQALVYLMNMILWWEKRKEFGKAISTGIENTVTFRNEAGNVDPFIAGSTVFVEILRCYDASGNNVSYNVTDATVDNFKIVVPVNCTIDYGAMGGAAALPS